MNATHYDVARGEVADLQMVGVEEATETTVQLGPLTCIANNLTSTNTGAMPDADIPALGQAFFYLFRDNGPDPEGGSYGADSDGHRRLAGGMDCPGNG